MSNQPKHGLRVCVALVIVAGLAAIFWLIRSSGGKPEAQPEEPAPLAVSASERTDSKASAELRVAGRVQQPEATMKTPERPAVASTPPQPVAADGMMESPPEDQRTAQELLAKLPTLEGEAQEEAVQELVMVADDTQFMAMAPLLTNLQSSAAIQELLFTELFNRAEAVKLPLCLAVARVDGHAYQEEAHTALRLYWDEDHGTNWTAWQQAIETRLRATAEEL